MVPDAIPALKAQQPGKDVLVEQPAYDLIELFFFAYRDFVSDPDRILDEYGFGRAHHRVLHFVSRQPGLTIAELLDILRITKQSLNRVLKELIEKDFIESRMGTSDRRQRLLFATSKGHDLALKLAKLQTRRIMRALSDMDPEAKETVSRYLLSLIDPDDNAHVKQLVFGPKKT
ncbi:MarR family winged helix-turn-helix transcriptional regulator [Microvirga lotononidis]|uniref:Transcriptional regulator n=1 Tax=Microvirga lotononidis TaxID=864069 RepID=I4YPF2_9HYPH|nr:MarR family transcriptional regulator [Microvirga lotononidis]EIM25844.1 transcriptional regulator [Microvirga lotononidis]WQO25764.1 MarR family transcriptional regulator [Microvirga lotononidis]